MTVSLRTRILGVLSRGVRRYAGHRTLADVIGSTETLQRQRGDIGDSAVRVSDLDPIFEQLLQYHLQTSDHAASSTLTYDFDEGSASAVYTPMIFDFEEGGA